MVAKTKTKTRASRPPRQYPPYQIITKDGKKECMSCSQLLSLDHFTINRIKPSGYENSCKKCVLIYKHKTSDKRVQPINERGLAIRKGISLVAEIKEQLKDADCFKLKQIATKVIDMAIDGNEQAIKMVLERVDGGVKQQVELKNNEDSPVTFIIAQADDLITKLRGRVIEHEGPILIEE